MGQLLYAMSKQNIQEQMNLLLYSYKVTDCQMERCDALSPDLPYYSSRSHNYSCHEIMKIQRLNQWLNETAIIIQLIVVCKQWIPQNRGIEQN